MTTRTRRSAPALVLALTAALAATLLLTSTGPASADRKPGGKPGHDRSVVGNIAKDELHVMSFNLRYASDTPPNSWAERRPVMRDLLRRERPALIGTQEGLYAQLRDIESDLGRDYDSIGLGRDGGSDGEAMQVFYDTRRLEPLAYDHYWLSDSPDVVGSKTWAGCCARMVTWVRFLDRRTGAELYALNTHLEAFDAGTRAKSVALIEQRIAEDFEPGVPVVMTGDFNEPAAPGETVWDALVGDGSFVDTWLAGDQRTPAWGTFNNYSPPTVGNDRIDWILTSPGIDVGAVAVDAYRSRSGQYPSDHLPVHAVLRLPR